MKKSFAVLTFITMAVALSLTFGLMSKQTASSQTLAVTSLQGVSNDQIVVIGLSNDNILYALTGGSLAFNRLGGTVGGLSRGEQLVGIDFRPSNGLLYGVTDRQRVGIISGLTGNVTFNQVSTLQTSFAGGAQNLLDFNAVVDAARYIGSNTQNYALVGANLNTTAVQTALAYDTNDVAAGTLPYIACGAYNNAFAGAANTIFYMADFNRDTLVTISTVNATGSSNTGGGRLRTIGQINSNIGLVNITPTADMDIVTLPNRTNVAILATGGNLCAFRADIPFTATQTVNAICTSFRTSSATTDLLDIAVRPLAGVGANVVVSR